MDVGRTCEVTLRESSDADVVHGAGGIASPVRNLGHLGSAHLNANLAKPAPNAVWRQNPNIREGNAVGPIICEDGVVFQPIRMYGRFRQRWTHG